MKQRALWRTVSSCGAALLAAWHLHAAAAPDAASDAVCRPNFQVQGQSLHAGTAFVLADPFKAERYVLLTAHHLFGEAGGLPADLRWQELPEAVRSGRCKWLHSGRAELYMSRPLAVKDAASFYRPGSRRDLAVFALAQKPAAPVNPLRLAASAPAPGDKVWLVARLLSGAPTSQFLHPATLIKTGDGAQLYLFDNPEVNIQATSGAPLVNEAGEVVGLHTGGGQRAGQAFGSGMDWQALRNALADLP